MSHNGIQVGVREADLKKINHCLTYEEARVIRRCNILHALHLGYGIKAISVLLQVHRNTVRNIGLTYNERGLDAALYDEERSGRPIDFDDRERSRIIAMVCSEPPKGYYRWTLNLIVEESTTRKLIKGTISREQVRIILQEHDLKPWQEKKLWGKFEVHYTPCHASWLNQAEIAIGIYSRQCLGDGRIGDLENLKTQTRAWNKKTNKKKIKIHWRFTKKKARKSLLYTPA